MRSATLLIILVLLGAALGTAFAWPGTRSGHIVLLTVAEDAQDPFAERVGGTADITLDIRPGSGKIFIDSFPLTKLDTQSSVRFANQVACSYLEEDCSRYDFFYTIRAGSIVVGGPSAGGAIAVLTAAVLEGDTLNESVAMTGTINSGGLIGPVAGVKEKALAAKARGITLVLNSGFSVATELNLTYARELNASNATNESDFNLSRLYLTVNLSALPIEVRDVATLEEALVIFTGKPGTSKELPELTEDPSYTATMQQVASDLCARRVQLLVSLGEGADENVTRRLADATNRSDWYSLASYCFSDLIKLRSKEYEAFSQRQRKTVFSQLAERIDVFERNVAQRNLSTLAELETSMIVTERLDEARDALADENVSNLSADGLGFAYERANSADVWSAFFRMHSPAFSLQEDALASACTSKLNEAEERVNYAELYLPVRYLEEANKELALARTDAYEQKHVECLFRASKAQADADLLAGSLSVPKEKLDWLVAQKLSAAQLVLRREEEKGIFPILGYSYYRYAKSLAAHDPYSALTFAEYSIELSNIDMYFPKGHAARVPAETLPVIVLFLCGTLFGAIIGFVVARRLWRTKQRKGKIEKRRRR